MKKTDFLSIQDVRRDLETLPGMAELIEEERAALRAAEFIEQTRKAAHLTQAKLAERIGVSQARVSQMEQGVGRYGPTLSLLERIASACGGHLNLTFEKR